MLNFRLLRGALLSGMLAASAAAADDAAMKRARQIVSGTCFLCHGAKGEAASELYPRLAGQNTLYIAAQLANFKSGARGSPTMRKIAAPLSQDDMLALGNFFSRQHAAPHEVADAAAAARGKAVYELGGAAAGATACTGCHGATAHGTEKLPRLAGQVASYIVMQLKSFGTRQRTDDNELMHTIAAKLTEREMRDVAVYLSSLE